MATECIFWCDGIPPKRTLHRGHQLEAGYHVMRMKNVEHMNRVREIENGSFTPLVFSTSGGMGKAAKITCNLDKPLTINAKLNLHETRSLWATKPQLLSAHMLLVEQTGRNIWMKIWQGCIYWSYPIASTSAQLQCYLVCESLPLIQVDYRIKVENNKQCHHSSLQAIHRGIDALSVPTDIQSCI